MMRHRLLVAAPLVWAALCAPQLAQAQGSAAAPSPSALAPPTAVPGSQGIPADELFDPQPSPNIAGAQEYAHNCMYLEVTGGTAHLPTPDANAQRIADYFQRMVRPEQLVEQLVRTAMLPLVQQMFERQALRADTAGANQIVDNIVATMRTCRPHTRRMSALVLPILAQRLPDDQKVAIVQLLSDDANRQAVAAMLQQRLSQTSNATLTNGQSGTTSAASTPELTDAEWARMSAAISPSARATLLSIYRDDRKRATFTQFGEYVVQALSETALIYNQYSNLMEPHLRRLVITQVDDYKQKTLSTSPARP